ncbi:YgaP family membrane protein [Corynebacterium marinum]|uniref:Inner membrane protein YgaP-like transmembrane domain-containing protein n=2 Tax=Corynebacterium marinum TaxID=349751 RepID=A0A0B6TTF2_9CORY|nr:DUF2892 domain-containing protein [Corynebacterium marinum]AJK68036.1 hypothetical protein B840_02040 [Corynebacterium marinum DSM 44953]NLF89919.1 DUF2892 domain-containing protein [Corynebacterium marinum]GGO11137.1 hypothetical protein GCM10010980_02110 [Corynebacterium marinum]
MLRNVAPLDRALRGGAAFVAANVAANLPDSKKPVKFGLLALAVVLGVTAAIGFCPLYRLLGISTRTAGN